MLGSRRVSIERRLLRPLAPATIALALIATVVFSGSRSGLLGVAAVLVAQAALASHASRRGRRAVIAALVLLAGAAVAGLVLFEHDYGYCQLRNVHQHPNDFCTCSSPDHPAQRLYAAARRILYTTRYHYKAQNVTLQGRHADRSVIVGSSAWSRQDLEYMAGLDVTQKGEHFVIMRSEWPHKGMHIAIAYAQQEGIPVRLVSSAHPAGMYQAFARAQGFLFFPQWREPSGRVAVEALLMGCRVLHNDDVGHTHEPWFGTMDRDALFTFLHSQRVKFARLVTTLITEPAV